MADVMFKKALEMASKTWKDAMNAPSSTGKDSYEDGRYQAVIKGATLGLSQSSGRLQVAWTYEFIDGQYVGKTKMDWDGCDTLENQIWLGRKLAKLGYEVPEDISDLEPILAEIVKSRRVVVITLKTKGEFQKVYIDRVSEEEATAETQTEAETEEASLEVGMKVSFLLKGEKVEGEVLEILEQEEKVKVKTSAGKVYKLSPDALELVLEEEEEAPVEEVIEEVIEEEVPEEPVQSKVTKKLPTKPVAKKKKR